MDSNYSFKWIPPVAFKASCLQDSGHARVWKAVDREAWAVLCIPRPRHVRLGTVPFRDGETSISLPLAALGDMGGIGHAGRRVLIVGALLFRAGREAIGRRGW